MEPERRPHELTNTTEKTFAGMQRPRLLLPPKLTSVGPSGVRGGTVIKREKKDSGDTSSHSDTSLEDTESNSDSEKVTTPPTGMAPPPPLRNIPHQTPDASPSTSQLFSQAAAATGGGGGGGGGGGAVGGVGEAAAMAAAARTANFASSQLPPSLPLATSPATAVVRLPTTVSVLPSPARQSQRALAFPDDSLHTTTTGVTPPAHPQLLPSVGSSPRGPSLLPPRLPRVGTPSSTIAASSPLPPPLPPPTLLPSHQPDPELTSTQPVLTSTPKKTVNSVESADQAKGPPMSNLSGRDSSKIVQEMNSGIAESVAGGDDVDGENTQQNQIPQPVAALLSQQVINGQVSGARKKPQQRKPSLELQRRMSQKNSSSSDSSDSESTSSNGESEEDEERDEFDPVMQRRSLPMVSRQTSLGAISGRHILPPLSNPAALMTAGGTTVMPKMPSVLPPLRIGTPPMHQVPPSSLNLPSYQEARSALVGGSHWSGLGGTSSPTAVFMRDAREHNRTFDGLGQSNNNNNLQNLSDEPIHLAAMEGVSASQMKTLALKHGVDFRDVGGRTALMYAVLGNQPKMCEVLIKLKATIDAKDLAGLTALLWATYQARPEVMRVLLKNGADVRYEDSDGRTAFHWSMRTPTIHCLKWLCKYANIPEVINKQDDEGLTALHWGVMSDQAPHIKHLLAMTKADVSIQDTQGRTPLNYAVLNFSPSCIRAILDYNDGAAKLKDAKGRSALHYACTEGSADCVRTLLSYQSCDIHSVDNNGTTPLHWAAAANQPGLIQLLIRRGADRDQRDNSDFTPSDYAVQRGHSDCVKILQSYGHRRPGSATSLASRSNVSITSVRMEPQNLDEHGHVMFHRPNRRFSLSGVSMSSMDRLPADGQAQSEGTQDGETDERRHEQAGEEQLPPQNGGQRQDTVRGTGVEDDTTHHHTTTSQSEEQDYPHTPQRSRIASLLCGCCAKRSSTVVPI